MVCGRSAKEASVAETASARKTEAGEELREAVETRLVLGLADCGFFSRRGGKTLEGLGLRSNILGD